MNNKHTETNMISTVPMLVNLPAPQPSLLFLSNCHATMPTTFEVFSHQQESSSPCIEFRPNYEYDVVCGRGKGSYNRPGNKRFREIAMKYVPEYTAAKCRQGKTAVLNEIISVVKEQNNGTARFIKYDKSKGWFEITNEVAREKVGHAVREALASLKNKGQKEEIKKCFNQKQNNLLAQQQAMFSNMLRTNCDFTDQTVVGV